MYSWHLYEKHKISQSDLYRPMMVNLQREADFRGGWGVLSLAQASQAVVVGGVRGGLPLGFERLEGFD